MKQNNFHYKIGLPILVVFLFSFLFLKTVYAITYSADNMSSITCARDSQNAGDGCANAFDRNISSVWTSAITSYPHWVSVDYGTSTTPILRKYGIAPSGDSAGNPTAWTFQGSTDNSNWISLDSQTSQSMVANTENTYYITQASSSAYRYYRFYFTQASGVYSQIAELYGYTCTDDCGTLTPMDQVSIIYQYLHFLFDFLLVGISAYFTYKFVA